jgi:multidrug transporter EmrE-like cation transporter
MNTGYLYVAGTIALGVCGQLIVKWQTDKAGSFPDSAGDRVRYFVDFLLNPWVIFALALVFIGLLCWIAALSKVELSRAYPFVAATFVLVLFFGAVFFDEPITASKVIGAALIVAGLIVGSQV